MDRVILHVDMDGFFAAIEQLDHPELRGRPVLVGSDAPRGVVTTASYEARPYGCHSAQPMAAAKRCCPHAIVVPARFGRYREVSEKLFALFEDFTPLVEPLSIDEAFLDVTGSQRLLGEGASIARKLKRKIRDTVNLTASVGIAFNKFLAKLASDMDKPDGLTLIDRENLDAVLLPLPVSKLWGVGPSMGSKLQRLSIHSIADLRGLSQASLEARFGKAGHQLNRLARGIDDHRVVCDRRARSIGQEQTFTVDLEHPNAVRDVLMGQAEQVGRRLRKHSLRTRRVTIKIRFGEFQTVTRSMTLDQATDLTDPIRATAGTLFDKWVCAGFRPVRLIGIHIQRLSGGRDAEQLNLFPDPKRRKARLLDEALDHISDRFGSGAIRRGARG